MLRQISIALLLAAISLPLSACATGSRALRLDVQTVPLNPMTPAQQAIGEFSFAGGVLLTGPDAPHELSDIVVFADGRFTAVSDEGKLFDGRLVLDQARRLLGITGTRVRPLLGTDGMPLTGTPAADAEGLAILPNGDFVISFEREHRIALYPAGGGFPRAVPAPQEPFPLNGGMEALALDPTAGPDAYVVGAETTGKTWTCRVSTRCEPGPTIQLPPDFSLVAFHRLTRGRTACLLRAWDEQRGNRIILRILDGDMIVAQMSLEPPMTVDNFEGLSAVPGPGTIRFYLVSDDNASGEQRTLLLAFDWPDR